MKLRVLTLVLGASLAVAAWADGPSELKASVQANFAKATAVYKAKNEAGLRRLITTMSTKDYSETDTQGKTRNLEECITLNIQHMKELKHINSFGLKIASARVKGDTGFTDEVFTLEATVMAPKDLKNPSSGMSIHQLKVWSASKGEYKKVGGKWLSHSSKSTSEKVWLDGKLMPNM